MAARRSQSDFAGLFKKFRLKSQIETLSEFGDLLAEEGYIYENSLFTRWQNGERIPKDRLLLLKIIEIFAKQGGMNTAIEANTFLESAGQRNLTENEELEISDFFNVGLQTLPEKINIFIGREQIIKDITWYVLNKKKVLLYGPAGVGKTAICIQIGHILADKFTNRVLWLRADLKKPDDIVDEILQSFGHDLKTNPNTDYKIKFLKSILKTKSLFLILDNVEEKSISSSVFIDLLKLEIPILITSNKSLFKEVIENQMQIAPFTQEEFIKLAMMVLGRPFVLQNQKKIERLGHLLGYLPISSIIIMKQIFSNPSGLKQYILQLENKHISLQSLAYDNKNLFLSIELLFSKLEHTLQKLLISCSIFEGGDFNEKAAAYINDMNINKTKIALSQLHDNSLLELSSKSRYRFNPTIKLYLHQKILGNQAYAKLARYYYEHSSLNTKNYVGDQIPFKELSLEIDNIVSLIIQCDKLKMYDEISKLWPSISTFLWLSGRWKTILSLDSLLQRAFLKTGNKRQLGFYLVDDIGRVKYFYQDFKKTIIYLEKARKISKDIKDRGLMGLVEQKYGISFCHLSRYVESEIALRNAIILLNNKISYLEFIKSHIYIANLFIIVRNYSKATRYLNRAYKMSKENNLVDSLGMFYLYRGKLYLQRKKYAEAGESFHNALIIDKKLNRKFGSALAYEGLSIVAKNNNDNIKESYYIKIASNFYKELGMKVMAKKLKQKRDQILI